MTTNIPTVVTINGLTPTDPATLRQNLLNNVAGVDPGYTANLPGSLIEDIASTDVGALVVMEQARVDLINSLDPNGANDFLMTQLGNGIYGVTQNSTTNTSVYVTFTGPVGYIVQQGFIVSDGTYQYTVQDGGVIGTGGTSLPLFAVANVTGTWAVPIGTVTSLVTSVPLTITLTVNNLSAGTPGAAAESSQAYRARVLQAGLVSATGFATMLKTLLAEVPGVQTRLISVRQNGTAWEIICGGGDPYQVAYAIYQAIFYLPGLTGSILSPTGVTQANPAVITTNLNHGFITGNSVTITGAQGMTAINGTFTATVLSPTTFSIPVNTSAAPVYTGGAVITPNNRNITVTVTDFPDTYAITFVNPPQQVVGVQATWNTNSPNVVSPTAVAQLANPAIVSYINSIVAGQPINELILNEVFQQAVASALPASYLTRLVWAITINGLAVSPTSGTYIIPGDPESYFYTTTSNVVIAQG
jgi:hypothetical protein